MEQCSICLDALDGGVAALACGHRFHAACLASMAGAVGTASSTSRRGTLTACPNCRTTSRVAPVTSAAHGVGDKVLALWGYKWYPGVVDEVLEGGYKIAWDDGDEGEVPAAHVRDEQLAVDAPAARDASPPAVVTPQAATPDEPLSPARPPPPSQEELLAQVEKLRAENSQLKRSKLDEASTCNGVVELIKRYDRDGHARIDELDAAFKGIRLRRKKLKRKSASGTAAILKSWPCRRRSMRKCPGARGSGPSRKRSRPIWRGPSSGRLRRAAASSSTSPSLAVAPKTKPRIVSETCKIRERHDSEHGFCRVL